MLVLIQVASLRSARQAHVRNQTLSTQTNLLNPSIKLKIQKQKSRRRWRNCTLNRLCNLSPFIVPALFLFLFSFSYFFKVRKFLTFYSSLKSIKPSYTKLNHLKITAHYFSIYEIIYSRVFSLKIAI